MIQICEMLQLDEDIRKWEIDSETKYKIIISDKQQLEKWKAEEARILSVASSMSESCRKYINDVVKGSESYFGKSEKKEGFLEKYGDYIIAFGLGFLARDSIDSLGEGFAQSLIKGIYGST